jgi:hypothetical protein
LSYAKEDRDRVEELYDKFTDEGYKPWMDQRDLFPGEKWKLKIEQAIRQSDFFLAFLSTNSVTKRGYIQKEIKRGLEIWEEKLDSDIYLIPVRLEECIMPDSLSQVQWVNLFDANGWNMLLKAIEIGMQRREETN